MLNLVHPIQDEASFWQNAAAALGIQGCSKIDWGKRPSSSRQWDDQGVICQIWCQLEHGHSIMNPGKIPEVLQGSGHW